MSRALRAELVIEERAFDSDAIVVEHPLATPDETWGTTMWWHVDRLHEGGHLPDLTAVWRPLCLEALGRDGFESGVILEMRRRFTALLQKKGLEFNLFERKYAMAASRLALPICSVSLKEYVINRIFSATCTVLQ